MAYNESVESFQPRKILITIDLFGDLSENLIVYSLLITQNIICDYTLLYCLKKYDTPEIVSKMIDDLLENIERKYLFCANKKIKIIVSNENLLEATLQLEQEMDFDCVILNSSKHQNAQTMDEVSQNILFQVNSNILVIPPNVELVFPSNIGVLIEDFEQSNFEKLTAFNNYISQHNNVFINFVLFADSEKIRDNDRKALSEYQRFFDSNFTFTFIIQDQKGYCIFLKTIEANHGNAAVIAWNENSPFFKYYLNSKSKSFPYSSKLPTYYPKKKGSNDNIDLGFNLFL